MHVTLVKSEIVYGDGNSVYSSIQPPVDALNVFLEIFFKNLFHVDANRNCHGCTDVCQSAMTLHFGKPFHSNFRQCIPE